MCFLSGNSPTRKRFGAFSIWTKVAKNQRKTTFGVKWKNCEIHPHSVEPWWVNGAQIEQVGQQKCKTSLWGQFFWVVPPQKLCEACASVLSVTFHAVECGQFLAHSCPNQLGWSQKLQNQSLAPFLSWPPQKTVIGMLLGLKASFGALPPTFLVPKRPCFWSPKKAGFFGPGSWLI